MSMRLILIASLLFIATTSNLHVGFKRMYLCHLQERIKLQLVRAVVNMSADLIECSRGCMYDSNCFGFSVATATTTTNTTGSFSQAGVCFFHQEYLTHKTCNVNNAESNHLYYMKYGVCYNGGNWDKLSRKCVCSKDSLMVGMICTSRPRNCKDLSLAEYIPFQAEVPLKPLREAGEVNVHCTILEDGTAKTLIANNRRSKLQFNHTWAAYENGFGDSQRSKACWLGMKYVRGLIITTETPSKLSAVAEYGGPDGVVGEMRILGVQISNAFDSYRLTYTGHEKTGKFVGKSQRCFRDSNGIKFSAWDVGNDMDQSKKCGQLNGAGWWFYSCESPCNIFGSTYTYVSSTKTHRESYSLDQVRLADISTHELSYYLSATRLEIHQ